MHPVFHRMGTRTSPGMCQCFLVYVGVLLLGYALLGRGFAYLGMPPVYVGEIGLLLAAMVVCAHVLVSIWRSRLVWALVAFMVWGCLNTIPYIGSHGLNALRDGVQWGYALFALAVATALLQSGRLARVPGRYSRFARLFLVVVVPSYLVHMLARETLPRLPWGPEAVGGLALLSPKPGDIAVHLAGIAVFMTLGLSKKRLLGWTWLLIWVAAAALVAAVSRAALLTLALPLLTLILFRPMGRWLRMFVVILAGISVMAVFDVRIDLGREARPVSIDGFLSGIGSIVGDTGHSQLQGSKEWRLLWWNTIIDYTVFGEHFWTGKGFGVNLATADGFQVTSDNSLRSPHNGHLTLLARTGVPGLALWALLQGAFAWSLLTAYRSDRRARRDERADISLWIFLYWLAFLINASFDVYLEGPQGGIWFWSVFGLGIAHMLRRKVPPVHRKPTASESFP